MRITIHGAGGGEVTGSACLRVAYRDFTQTIEI